MFYFFFFFFFFFFFYYVSFVFFFFKQKTAYEMLRSLVGSEMCIRDSHDERSPAPCRRHRTTTPVARHHWQEGPRSGATPPRTPLGLRRERAMRDIDAARTAARRHRSPRRPV